jgi:signal transduction histidine kinase/CheY-like chemotaxis protein
MTEETKIQNIKRIVMSISFFTIMLFGVIISYSQNRFIEKDIQRDVRVQDDYIHKNFELFLNELKYDISVKTDILITHEQIVKSFAKQDREVLLSIVEQKYANMVKQNPFIKLLTFRLTDGSAFLRVHKPEVYGDMLSKKETIVLESLKTGFKQYGFEVSKYNMTYKSVTPVFYDNKLIGAVEIGADPEYIINKIDDIFDIQTALFIKKSFKDILEDQEYMEEKDDWLLARGDLLFKKYLNNIDLKNHHVSINLDNEMHHINNDINLYDNYKRVSAKLLVAYSTQRYIDNQEYTLKKNIFITLVSFFIISLVLHYGFNFYIKRLEKARKNLKKQYIELEKQNRDLATAQKISKLGSWSLDIVNDKLEWSDEIFKIFEIDKSTFGGTYESFLNAIHPDDFDMVNDTYNNSLLTKEKYVVEHRLLMQDGRIKWVREQADTQYNQDGKPVISIGTIQDITEQKTLSVELEELNRSLEIKVHERTKEVEKTAIKLKSAINLVNIGNWEMDIDKGLFYWSKEVFKILDLPYEEKISFQKVIQHIHPLDREKVETQLKSVIEKNINCTLYESQHDKEKMCDIEYRVVKKDGSVIYIHSRALIAEIKDGHPIKMTGALQDITELKETELEALEAKSVAENATKAKSEFLANMSHEIRTPLNAILGFVDLLKTQVKDKVALKHVGIIDQSSKSLLQIIEDILDFSKIESGNLLIEDISFNLHDEIKLLIKLFSAKCLEKHISLHLDIDKSVPEYIKSDPLRIKQIVSNLISNAIKFTDEGKNIYVDLSYKSGDLHISVRDEGRGIAKDKLSVIFEAFKQEDTSTTRKYGGTGLGLAISSKIVNMLGGVLSVKSKENEGSVFYFSIPVHISQKTLKDSEQISERTKFDGHILLVEDNRPNQMLMEIVLKKAGLTYKIANDGLEAIDAFQKEKFDIILMDENMPNLNGIDATKKILDIEYKENLEHTPIVALTANALKGDRERFLEAGMDEYLTKPINKKELIRILNIFL